MKRSLIILSLLFFSACAPTPAPEQMPPTPPPPAAPAEPLPVNEDAGGRTKEGMMEKTGTPEPEGAMEQAEPEDLSFGENFEAKVKTDTPDTQAAPPIDEGETSGVMEEPSKRTITVNAENWSFGPSVIRVKKGEMITIKLHGISGSHGFSVPGLGINVPIAVGEMKTITLPTDAAGTFDFLCSVPCGSGHRDMRGQVVIEE